MKRLIKWIFSGWVTLMFMVWLPVIVLFHLLVKLVRDESRRLWWIYKMHRIWIKSWEIFTGIHFRLLDQQNLEGISSAVFAVNHTSMLDILIVGSHLSKPTKYLAKRELLKVPFVGWIIQNVSIMVDRSSRQSRQASMLSMIQHLKRGISIVIFPEGTRNRSEKPLQSFHKGAFRIAIKGQVPIVPIVITGLRKLQPMGTYDFFPGTVEVSFLEPVSTEGMTAEDEGKLKDQVHSLMESHLLNHDPHYTQLGDKQVQMAGGG